ncbi:cadmium transporter [Ligilactobacillus ruminis]|uniref:Cadmium transporter n=1 Tax=Ligilactobacillus ruminis TaxID=1623 RepID=A0A8B2Z700_9LACO|nr:cadmium transporter [Ligilactobacillus ruminis]
MLSLSNAEQNIQKRVDCVIKSNNGNLFKVFLCLIKERNFCDLFEKEKRCNDMH